MYVLKKISDICEHVHYVSCEVELFIRDSDWILHCNAVVLINSNIYKKRVFNTLYYKCSN